MTIEKQYSLFKKPCASSVRLLLVSLFNPINMWSQESLWGPLKSQNEPCNCNTPMLQTPCGWLDCTKGPDTCSRIGRKLDIQNVTEATELVMVPLHWLKVIRVSNLRVVGNKWLIDSIYESPINFSLLESWNWSKVRLDGGWSWMGVGRYVLKNAKKYKHVKNIQSCIVS